MAYIILTQDERLHLNRALKNFSKLEAKKQEETQLRVLQLMDSYIKELAYKYAGKSYVPYEDYVAEMQLAVLKQIPRLKPNNVSKKQIETYLYYWCNDACQRLLADMNGPVSYSVTIMRKGFRGEEKIITKEGLNNKVSVDDSKEFVDTVKSTGDPYSDLVLSEERKEFRDTIVSKFGENAFNAFWKKYALNKAYQKRYEKTIEEIFSFIKNSPHMIEILQDLAASSN